MSVEIEPQELGFRRPFTVEVSEVLKIKNPTSQPITFKVKTTAPKQYCVRPNSGRVEPGREVEVQVILQAMKQEPPLDIKCRDKFLVQSVAISSDLEFSNLSEIWEKVERSQILEKKIRVVFLPATGSSSAAAGTETPNRQSLVNGHDTPADAPPAYSSPSDFVSKSPAEDKSVKRDSSEIPAAAATGAGAGLAGAAALATTKNSNPSYDELKAQLEAAERTIAQLKSDQGGLRQRNVGGTASSEKSIPTKPAELAQAVRQGTEGVPVQITAILCLVSFLLAYIFF